MSVCPSCASVVPDPSRFCLSCGSPMESSEVPTIFDARHFPPATPVSGPDGALARFDAGQMISGRYRIIGKLGAGGMGEVYRADDLKLGQPVALKFLPPLFASDPGRLARFHNEVRVARQVSHANICRVYDIGEADGQHFLSMEYVDGEDLASLLRRIGRLPGDKAVEIARQLCAGLAAAHERGVLHRDLKPSNVMIDGKGRVRITDFGLAGLETELKGATSREGTPYYMAPEQLAGKGVSARSDIYSLGLVLYEVLTGRPPFKADSMAEMSRLRDESVPETPSSIVNDLDPALERVILRCLEKDPEDRPASALAVAAALPGGDPLAAALAAGETPSPEMVAASGEVGGIRPAAGAAALAAIVGALILSAALGPWLLLPGRVPLDDPPEVLAVKARETAGRLGYAGPPADAAGSFRTDAETIRYIDQHDPSLDRWEKLRSGRPAALQYWHRESPRPLEATDFFAHLIGTAVVEPEDPPPLLSGMVEIRLDTLGRLIGMAAVPPQVDRPEAPAPGFDWSRLFPEAGLDASQFEPAPSEWLPPSFADARQSWVRKDPARTDLPDRLEAASYRGRLVYYQEVWPWTRPARMQPRQLSRGERTNQIVLLAIFAAVLVGALLVARHNLRLGRGDRRGATRLAWFVLVSLMVVWLLRASHVMTMYEFGLFVMGASGASFGAGVVWVVYVALEPYVRRRWPGILVSWNRLLAGRWHDPLVGRDLLLGTLFGAGMQVFVILVRLAVWQLGLVPLAPAAAPSSALMGVRFVLPDLLLRLQLYTFLSLSVLFLLFIFRAILRNGWLAAVVFTAIFAANGAAGSELPWLGLILSATIWGTILLIMMRVGLLALVACLFTLSTAQSQLLALSPSVWYAPGVYVTMLLVAALALHGLRVALGGRRIFSAITLEA